MYSYITKDKEVLDWKFTKMQYGYNFYIGDKLLGQIFDNRPRRGWQAISWSNPGNHVKGFLNRQCAAEYLIEVYDNSIEENT